MNYCQNCADLTAKLQAAEAMVATAHPPKMIRDLVSKLQAAEEALAADDQASHIIEWKSRAEAAEAEVERLTDCLETQYEINRNTARAACEARGDHFDAEDRIAELEAEVARLKGQNRHDSEADRACRELLVEELDEALAKVKELRAELSTAKRTATEAALRYVQKRWPHFYLNESDIQSAIKALLGEEE